MPVRIKLKARYEINEVLGEGATGMVYKAYDPMIKRELALKTIRDIPDPKALQLFQKECGVLASMSHPNIVEIFDIGELEEEGQTKPFFVMPLLRGIPLDKLIRDAGHRLTVERAVDIVCQTCQALHAAHERGLVHGDLKPSNIFVMEDGSVKVLDFGVAHLRTSGGRVGLGGTLSYAAPELPPVGEPAPAGQLRPPSQRPRGAVSYMAPEQLGMKPPSAASDIFSLGVVSYETLTCRQPFGRPTEREIIEAILHQVPPPASELNSGVSRSLSRVIHKAMAKQPEHRFSSAREFAETLQKALRNVPIELFNPAYIQPRIQSAIRAFEQADYQSATEILSELEAEGHIDARISSLRRRIGQAEHQKAALKLLESAFAHFEQDEFRLAIQEIQEVLRLDPENAAALSLKTNVEKKLTQRKIEDGLRSARQHIENQAYGPARQALEKVLQFRPTENRAAQLLAEVDRYEQEILRLRREKEDLYQAARTAWQKGEIDVAFNKMGLVVELERSPADPAAKCRAIYQNFYNQVCSEYDAINKACAEARKHLQERSFAKALVICDEGLAKYPGYAPLRTLKFDVEEQQRQELTVFTAEIDRRVEAEPDLDRRISILKEALNLRPDDPHLEQSLRLAREKQDLVNSIVTRARLHEERGELNEALGQWESLKTVHRQFPGLNLEIERVVKRRDEQTRLEAKARWVEQIGRRLQSADYAQAIDLSQKALAEFLSDPELAELEKRARQGMERAAQIQRLLDEGQKLCAQRRFQEGLETLRKAYQLDSGNPFIRAALSDALVEQAHGLLDTDWRSAEVLIEEALEIDPGHALAKSLRALAYELKRQEFMEKCVSLARELQAAGDLEGARAEVERGLSSNPLEPTLTQLLTTLDQEVLESQRQQARQRDLEEIRGLERESETVRDLAAIKALFERAQALAQQYAEDPEFQSVATDIGGRLTSMTARLESELLSGMEEAGNEPAEAAGATAVLADLPFLSPQTPLDPLRAWDSGRSFPTVPPSPGEQTGPQPQASVPAFDAILERAKVSEGPEVKSTEPHASAFHQPEWSRRRKWAVAGVLTVLILWVVAYRIHHKPKQGSSRNTELMPPASPAKPQLPIRATGAIRGRVVDRRGKALRDVQVKATDQTGKVLHITRTDAAGHFQLADLPAGTYMLKAEAPPGYASSEPVREVTLIGGQQLDKDLWLYDVALARATAAKTEPREKPSPASKWSRRSEADRVTPNTSPSLPGVTTSGQVMIVTVPPNLEVLIDGRSHGPSPVVTTISVGQHMCSIKAGGMEVAKHPFTQELSSQYIQMKIRGLSVGATGSGNINTSPGAAVSESDRSPNVSPSGSSAATIGTVQVLTIPLGADVLVDGTVSGKTPADLKMVAGHHILTLSLPGCRPQQKEVDVTAGGTVPLQVALHCQ